MDTESSVPADLREAFVAAPGAEAAWNGLTPISRRDFTRWINEAKQPETRQRRVRVAIDKLKSGQRRPCCYAIPPMDLYKALCEAPEAKAHWSDLKANEKRDFCDWLEDSEDKAARKGRIGEICAMLAAGKRGP